jgi:hypothetical protein
MDGYKRFEVFGVLYMKRLSRLSTQRDLAVSVSYLIDHKNVYKTSLNNLFKFNIS